jgi:hypothetical protein
MFLAALIGLTGCDAVRLTTDGGDAAQTGDARDASDARDDANGDVPRADATPEVGGIDAAPDHADAAGDGGAGTDGNTDGATPDAADKPATVPDAVASDAADAPVSEVGAADAALEVASGDGATPDVAVDAASDASTPDAHDAQTETAPACAMAFHDDWSKALSDSPEEGRPWYAPLGSPSTDENGLMMVGHYDSIQRAPLTGGYTMAFDLLIDGDLDFFVGMPAVSLDVPSLVRMGDKIALTGSHWGTTALVPLVEGHFDGRLVNDAQMRVNFYMKATSRTCAMRVQLGGNTYRSGFVPCANPDTAVDGKDVSTPQLTGNASFGTLGYAHLGVIDGCAGLSDAAVAAAYGP